MVTVGVGVGAGGVVDRQVRLAGAFGLRMISRSGTRTSGASSGVTKILREAGSGPVVTAGRVVSGLERMFMGILL